MSESEAKVGAGSVSALVVLLFLVVVDVLLGEGDGAELVEGGGRSCVDREEE